MEASPTLLESVDICVRVVSPGIGHGKYRGIRDSTRRMGDEDRGVGGTTRVMGGTSNMGGPNFVAPNEPRTMRNARHEEVGGRKGGGLWSEVSGGWRSLGRGWKERGDDAAAGKGVFAEKRQKEVV